MPINNELVLLIDVLPAELADVIEPYVTDDVTDIFLDLGRCPQIQYSYRPKPIEVDSICITSSHIEEIEANLPPFGYSNRVGLPKTLHRVSRIRNRNGQTIGFTLRIGRAVENSLPLIEDLLYKKNVLILGKPGAGKTTLLWAVCKRISEQFSSVMIVDKTSEIGGESDIPHPAIGKSRRIQVRDGKSYAQTMIEALENHTVKCIALDEISNKMEAKAAETIARRGIQLIATAHGKGIEDLLKNPELNCLLGGLQVVTLGDDEAKLRGSSKTVQEREQQPIFDIIVHVVDFNTVQIYKDLELVVDSILVGGQVEPEERRLNDGKVYKIRSQSISMDKLSKKPVSTNGKLTKNHLGVT